MRELHLEFFPNLILSPADWRRLYQIIFKTPGVDALHVSDIAGELKDCNSLENGTSCQRQLLLNRVYGGYLSNIECDVVPK